MKPLKPDQTAAMVLKDETCLEVLPESVQLALKLLAKDYQALREAVSDEVGQLERWAGESVSGGWSTHQVQPMRTRADQLRRILIPSG